MENVRARRLDAPSTLTEIEWVQTLADFNGLCAYCLYEPFTVMEHFLPVHIGGTSVKNCIPACRSCNNKKGDAVDERLVEKFGEDVITRIRAYLYNGRKPDIPSPEALSERIERHKRQKRHLPPRKTLYYAVSEAHAAKLRSEGKEHVEISQ
jgi:hypothetical protein